MAGQDDEGEVDDNDAFPPQRWPLPVSVWPTAAPWQGAGPRCGAFPTRGTCRGEAGPLKMGIKPGGFARLPGLMP